MTYKAMAGYYRTLPATVGASPDGGSAAPGGGVR